MYQSLREWLRSTFGLAMLGAALLWAALPPLDFAPLAWIAPVFWILLIRAEKLPQYVGASSQTTGKRPTGKPDEPGRPWLLIVAAGLLFGVEMFVTDWFHARKYE